MKSHAADRALCASTEICVTQALNCESAFDEHTRLPCAKQPSGGV